MTIGISITPKLIISRSLFFCGELSKRTLRYTLFAAFEYLRTVIHSPEDLHKHEKEHTPIR